MCGRKEQAPVSSFFHSCLNAISCLNARGGIKSQMSVGDMPLCLALFEGYTKPNVVVQVFHSHYYKRALSQSIDNFCTTICFGN